MEKTIADLEVGIAKAKPENRTASINMNKVQAAGCMMASAAASIALIAWLIKTLA